MMLFADASCKGNRLGWGFVLKGDETIEAAGKGSHGINQTELLAVLKGLDCVPPASEVTVFTDSVYVLRAARGYGGFFRDQLLKHQTNKRIKFVKVGKGKGPCPEHRRAHHLAREITTGD